MVRRSDDNKTELRQELAVSRRTLVFGTALGLSFLSPVSTLAQSESHMINAFRSARDFRARVQAAFALGRTQNSRMRRVLEAGLRDDHPAVRAAAATALGDLGDPRASAALNRAQRDSAAAVRLQARAAIRRLENAETPSESSMRETIQEREGAFADFTSEAREGRVNWRQVRYVVLVGDVARQQQVRLPRGSNEEALLLALRRQMFRQVRAYRGVAVFDSTAGGIPRSAQRQVERRDLPKLRLDGNLTGASYRRGRGQLSVETSVNVLILTEPGRDLRGMVSGSGSSEGRVTRQAFAERREELSTEAITGATRSAMSGIARALHAAASR